MENPAKSSGSAQAKRQLWFGTATRDITPTYPLWVYSWMTNDHKSEGVADPLYLGCLAVGNGEETVLLITCDLLGIEWPVCERFYGLIQAETGIGFPHILISCTHTHFAPGLYTMRSRSPHVGLVDPDPRFVEDVETKLLEAVKESLRNRRPGQLESARVPVPAVLYNRRTICPDGQVRNNNRYPLDAEQYTFSPVDDELTILRFRQEQGIGAILLNFGCHPVCSGPGGPDHYRLSGDYTAYARQTLEQAYQCPVFFTMGGGGDTVPLDRYGDSRQRVGRALGNSAILAERAFRQDTSNDIRAESLSVEAQTVIAADPQVAEAEFERTRAEMAPLYDDASLDHRSAAYQTMADDYERKMTTLYRLGLYAGNRFTVRPQLITIGGTTLVSLPFEVLCEFSLRLKSAHPGSVLVSCAGGYQEYLPLAHEYERGGYETSDLASAFVPGTADRLLAAVLDKLGESSS